MRETTHKRPWYGRPTVSEQKDAGSAGDTVVWSITGTLLAGPGLYGVIGWGIDEIAGTSFWLPIGIVIGFILSGYIIYMRYGRG